ncbi:ankyrin repeat domain-containing protein [Bacillus sp. NP157]|nr:ankyrin repeat domain-containing protein [Bacillus sp. NP157]
MTTNAQRYALHLAVAQADLSTVAALLKAGADPNRRLPSQLWERTALHVCVAAYSAALHTMRTREAHALEVICARLLEAGAALDHRDTKGLIPSAVADTMPRALAVAVRQRAFDDVGCFDPHPAGDNDVEWLMDPESLRLDPLSGARYTDRYAAAIAAAQSTLRRRDLLERARAQGGCGKFRRQPVVAHHTRGAAKHSLDGASHEAIQA